jgi:hypothetical protein
MRYVTGFAIPAGTSDASGNTTGLKVSAAQWAYVSFHAYFSEATAAGTIQIQFSNDNPSNTTEENFVPTNWVNVPGATATAMVTAGASVAVYPPNGFVGRWYRITFTRTGGAGTFAITFCGLSA